MKRRVLGILLTAAMMTSMTAASVMAEDSSFNPDTETDTIAYDKLEEEFGPLSDLELPEEVSIGGILKNQANEFWLSQGYPGNQNRDRYSRAAFHCRDYATE